MTEQPTFEETPQRNEMIDRITAAFTKEVRSQQEQVYGEDLAKVRSEAAAVYSRLDLTRLAEMALNIIAIQMMADMRAAQKEGGGELNLEQLKAALASNPKIMFRDTTEEENPDAPH